MSIWCSVKGNIRVINKYFSVKKYVDELLSDTGYDYTVEVSSTTLHSGEYEVEFDIAICEDSTPAMNLVDEIATTLRVMSPQSGRIEVNVRY